MVAEVGTEWNLTLGSSLQLWDYGGETWHVAVTEGSDGLGNPVPVIDQMESLLRDGDLSYITKDGNRVASLFLCVTGRTEHDLDLFEMTLLAETDKVNTLLYERPGGAPMILDVVTSYSELQHLPINATVLNRIYKVTFECLPYGRSVEPEVIEWTAPYTQVTDLSSTTGWTVVGGGEIQVGTGLLGALFGARYLRRTTAGTLRLRRTFVLDEYLRLGVDGIAGDTDVVNTVTVDGVAIDKTTFNFEGNAGVYSVVTIPTGPWRGGSHVVEFTIKQGTDTGLATLYSIYTESYPNKNPSALTAPKGIGVIDVGGTARTGCMLEFTIPADRGAFIYTAPDPNEALRRGSGEVMFAQFEALTDDGVVVDVGPWSQWFPKGVHATTVGVTAARPTRLYPGGVWPTLQTGKGVANVGDGAHETSYAYPVDRRAACAFFDTDGDKVIVTPSPDLPSGFQGDAPNNLWWVIPEDTGGASYYEVIGLHPGRCGFAVIDTDGNPVPCTITYDLRWKHNAEH